MNTFDRHLLREWLQILGLVLLATIGLLLVQVAYSDFRQLRDVGAEAKDIAAYFWVTVPSFLALVLPLALLISLLYALGQLHRANELTAMRAAGVGFFRLTRPIWIVGILCCGLTWYLNSTVVPSSVEESRALEERLQFRHQARTAAYDRVGVVNSVAFDQSEPRRMWFFNRYSTFRERGYGATVSLLDDAGREQTRILAAEAWSNGAGKGWTFKNGLELRIDPETSRLMEPVRFEEKIFPEFEEDPSLMLLIDRPAKEMSLFELRRIIDYFRARDNPKFVPYAVRYHGLLADTFAPLIVIAIAVPFAISGVRVNPAVGVSKSIGLFFLYYLLANLASSLASKQIIAPEVAAWLPNLGLAALAVWFLARLR